MANVITEQKLIDKNNRALLKYTMVGDGTAQANTTLVDVSMLSGALNTSGYIMSSNVNPLSYYGTTIRRMYGHINANNAGGSVKLTWGGSANTDIVVLGAGYFDFNFDDNAGGGAIPNNATSPTGDILYSTSLGPGGSFTLFLDLRKDNKYYDAGQSADPAAFNAYPWNLR